MKQILLVFAGGGLGSVIRYLVSAGIGQRHGTTFPLPTFIVNLGGSFLRK